MASIQPNAIYIASFWRPYPPGDPFHWGIVIQPNDAKPILFHARQQPSWVFHMEEGFDTRGPRVAVQMAKVGDVPESTTKAALQNFFQRIPIGHSVNYPDVEWRCNHWTRDAMRSLSDLGWASSEDVDGQWQRIRARAIDIRDQVANHEADCQFIDATGG